MKTEILEPSEFNIELAASKLRDGDVVAMPTETVYGLAANAFDVKAVARVFSVKERPTFDPLIVHVAPFSGGSALLNLENTGLVDTSRLSATARANVEKLLNAFWPGPFTIVLPKTSRVPDLVTSGLNSVAVRMPRHPVAQALIRKAGTPLAAPSANRFGRISPTTAQSVQEELEGRISVILDGGTCEIGLESTVVRVGEDGFVSLLRPGGIDKARLEKALSAAIGSATDVSKSVSPGLQESHYAPGTPFKLLEAPVMKLNEDQKARLSEAAFPEKLGLMIQSGTERLPAAVLAQLTSRVVVARSLSESGDLNEMARNLFATMRELDHSGAGLILAEPCLVQEGLGHAIADRMRRAAAR